MERKVKIRISLVEEVLDILSGAVDGDTAIVKAGRAWGLLKAFLETVPPLEEVQPLAEDAAE